MDSNLSASLISPLHLIFPRRANFEGSLRVSSLCPAPPCGLVYPLLSDLERYYLHLDTMGHILKTPEALVR